MQIVSGNRKTEFERKRLLVEDKDNRVKLRVVFLP
jgi:hypothetical protein